MCFIFCSFFIFGNAFFPPSQSATPLSNVSWKCVNAIYTLANIYRPWHDLLYVYLWHSTIQCNAHRYFHDKAYQNIMESFFILPVFVYLIIPTLSFASTGKYQLPRFVLHNIDGTLLQSSDASAIIKKKSLWISCKNGFALQI